MKLTKSVKFGVAVSTLAVVAGATILATGPRRRLDLAPLVRKRVLISDRMFGGSSDVALDSGASGIRFSYGLSPVSVHPWAGLNLGFTDSVNQPIDLGEWERLEIRASSSRHRPLRIQILSDDLPAGSQARDSAHPVYHAVEYVPDGGLAVFPWTVFTIPAWWREQFPRTEIQRLDLLDRFRAVEFLSGDSPSGRDSSVVDIQVLALDGPDRMARFFGWFLMGLGITGFCFPFVWKGRSTTVEGGGEAGATLVPGKVILEDPRAKQRLQLVQELQKRFPDPELSLESFAASQGLSPRLVASLIKDATKLHFKGALNELRLTEAARLLKETRGNVSEIAFAVGFQNASHFGRAFREKFGQSPSDYRSGGESGSQGG